jgi:hypothetical protein
VGVRSAKSKLSNDRDFGGFLLGLSAALDDKLINDFEDILIVKSNFLLISEEIENIESLERERDICW